MTEHLTDEKIEALVAAATPGPWDVDRFQRWGIWQVVAPASDGHPDFQRTVAERIQERDAEFIAAARDLVPALLARARKAEDENERLSRHGGFVAFSLFERVAGERDALAARLASAEAKLAAVRDWAMVNEIAAPPLDWAALGATLRTDDRDRSSAPEPTYEIPLVESVHNCVPEECSECRRTSDTSEQEARNDE